MHVLHLMQCTNLGGMEQATYRLMNKMSEEGRMHFNIVTPRPFGAGEPVLKTLDHQATDHQCAGRFGWRSRRTLSETISRRSAGCSLIWVTGTCAASLVASRTSPLPIILSHHYHHFESWKSWLRWRAFYELLCRRLYKIVFPTQFSRDEAVRIAPWLDRKATVIHNGVAPIDDSAENWERMRQRARQVLNIPADALVVGNAGWLIPRKRFDVFLQVASRIHKMRSGAVFVICGGGPLEGELRRMAAELGIADSVRFEGWVRDLEPFYQAFDVLLFNSDYDTFGLTALEAANHGAIVVASVRYGGLGEFIEHGINGFLFRQHDIQAMADIILYLNETSTSVGIRKNARKKVHQQYDIGASAAQYKKLFNSC